MSIVNAAEGEQQLQGCAVGAFPLRLEVASGILGCSEHIGLCFKSVVRRRISKTSSPISRAPSKSLRSIARLTVSSTGVSPFG